ncbi:hypothetical protein ANN_09613 [Periplaneta americana]|uniref:Uncharacterized protein n=1 Tax=Periplaneta americana TaxID=6978 RepID=A0ABQ8TN98_PERAM|nr:hypothetical protein ANN_09613 [Periplaneta americana]
MAGLCEGGNEPSGSLKAICKYECNIEELTHSSSRYVESQAFRISRTRLDAATVADPLKFTARRTQDFRLRCFRLDAATVTQVHVSVFLDLCGLEEGHDDLKADREGQRLAYMR